MNYRRLSFQQFLDHVEAFGQGNYDLVDVQEEYGTELFETGAVTVKLGARSFELVMTIDEVV